jgi:hypothetical protein
MLSIKFEYSRYYNCHEQDYKRNLKPLQSKPIAVITNGYDVENVETQALDIKFSLAHTGSFLSERNPMILWESLVS